MNNFGIMFHHFHDKNKHIISQGSIDSTMFVKVIDFLKSKYDIIDANIWYDNAINNKLKPNQICLTFDDALACQYDIAYPILKELKIKAFWFVYTSMFKGILEKLEIYRHFRFNNFNSIELFYDFFFKTAILNQNEFGIDIQSEIKQFKPNEYLQEFSFYTDDDKLFRYLRDSVLGQEKYNLIMDNMIKIHEYDIEANKNLLWIREEQLLDLHKSGHVIGLHSHTHPTFMAAKSYTEQMEEYSENKLILEKIISSDVSTVSYPCNSYNNGTDIIMKNLGIHLGFNATMQDGEVDNLHFPRKDHSYIIKEIII